MARVSLSKKQQETIAGADLIALCQTITEDGQIANEEIIDLRNWLAANRDSGLPAIDFLVETVERIITDRKVTREERTELHKALEKVLPPELRAEAKAKRQRAERKRREREGALCYMDFMVAGVRHKGRAAIISRYVTDGDQVFLVRDRQNAYSRNAIAVRLRNGLQIGFVPEDDAIEAAALLDSGDPHRAFVKKILGYDVPIPVIVAEIYRSDCGRKDVVFEQDIVSWVALPGGMTPEREADLMALERLRIEQDRRIRRQRQREMADQAINAIAGFLRLLPRRTDRLFRTIAGEGNDIVYYFLYVLLVAGCLAVLVWLSAWLL